MAFWIRVRLVACSDDFITLVRGSAKTEGKYVARKLFSHLRKSYEYAPHRIVTKLTQRPAGKFFLSANS